WISERNAMLLKLDKCHREGVTDSGEVVQGSYRGVSQEGAAPLPEDRPAVRADDAGGGPAKNLRDDFWGSIGVRLSILDNHVSCLIFRPAWRDVRGYIRRGCSTTSSCAATTGGKPFSTTAITKPT